MPKIEDHHIAAAQLAIKELAELAERRRGVNYVRFQRLAVIR